MCTCLHHLLHIHNSIQGIQINETKILKHIPSLMRLLNIQAKSHDSNDLGIITILTKNEKTTKAT